MKATAELIRKEGAPRQSTETTGSQVAQLLLMDQRPSTIRQRKLIEMAQSSIESRPVYQRKENRNGLPEQLRSGIENLSGYSMDNVRVHRNSARPAQLNAHAFAQGTDIHLGSGQEKHLPHEAWHVVQQMQGRVKPTTSVAGAAVNDNQSLEREADVMGSKAMQLKAKTSPNSLKRGQVVPAIQRKQNDLQTVPAASPFDNSNWAAANVGIAEYNLIPADDKVYTSHLKAVLAIKQLELSAYSTDYSSRSMTLIEVKRGVDERAVDPRAELQEREVELAQISNELNRLKSDRGGIQSRKEAGYQPTEFATEIDKVDWEKRTSFDAQRLPGIESQISSKGLEEDIAGFMVGLSRNNVEDVEAPQKKIENELTKLRRVKDARIGELNGEARAVDRQIRTSIDADFEEIPASSKKLAVGNRPAELNALAAKLRIENAKPAPDNNERLVIILEMDEKIDSWREAYLDSGTDNIKARYRDDTAKLTSRLQAIKQMERQLLYTRSLVFNAAFPANMPATKTDSTGKSAAKTLETELELGSKETIGTAYQIDSLKGPLTTWTGSQEFPGKKEEGDEGTGEEAEKAPNAGVIGSDLIKGGSTTVDSLKIAGGAGEMAAQIMKLTELRKVKEEWAEKDGPERAALVMGNVESAGKLVKAGEEVSEGVMNLVKGKEGDEAKNDSDLAKMAEGLKWTGALTSAIASVKGVVDGIVAIRASHKRKGVDTEKSITYGMKGTISLMSAIKSGFGVAKYVMKIIKTAVPPWLASAIPIIGIAMDTAGVIISTYQAIMAGKWEQKMKELNTPYEDKARSSDKLGEGTGVTTAQIGRVTEEQWRGVFSVAGGKKYRRFSAFILVKIDEHVAANGVGPLSIPLAIGETFDVTPEQISKIREYEYISKMQEVNQKRKVKGGTDVFLGIVNVAGNATILSGVGALVGKGITAGVSGFKGGHTLIKFLQQWRRNKVQEKTEAASHGGGTDLDGYRADRALFKFNGVDKSSKQKDIEYRRHAGYILDRIKLIKMPDSFEDKPQVLAALKEVKLSKMMLKATGVDYYDFINAENIEARFKLLVEAQSSGR